MMRCI